MCLLMLPALLSLPLGERQSEGPHVLCSSSRCRQGSAGLAVGH